MPDNVLPEGWTRIRLGELFQLKYGTSLPASARSGGSVPVVGSAGVVGGHATASAKGPGIVVGRKGSIGDVTWIATDFWPIDTTYYVDPVDGKCDLRWAYQLLQTLNLPGLNRATGVPGLNRDDVHAIVRAAPGLDEQRRIAEVLDSIDAAIEKTEAVIAATERLRSALLSELLTRGVPGWHTEWKQVPGIGTIPTCWEVTTIGTLGPPGGDVVLTGPFGAELRSADFTKVGVPVLNIGNVQDDGLHTEKLDHVSEETARRLARYRVRTGDLLFSRMATVGRATTVPVEYDGALISYHLMRLRIDPHRASSELIMYCIQGLLTVQRQIADISGGGTRLGVNSTGLRGLKVPLPGVAEQGQIVRILSGVRRRAIGEQHALHLLSRLKAGVADVLLSGRVRLRKRMEASNA